MALYTTDENGDPLTEIGRVTVSEGYTEGTPFGDLLEARTAYGAAYRYFAYHEGDMENTTLRRVSTTTTKGPESQFVGLDEEYPVPR